MSSPYRSFLSYTSIFAACSNNLFFVYDSNERFGESGGGTDAVTYMTLFSHKRQIIIDALLAEP